jgi:hypothetical protein
MLRGWEVAYADNTTINEEQMEWKALPKLNMIRLTLHYDGREWSFHDKVAYIQKKRGSMIPGVTESFKIESRSIGYYDIIDEKNCKVWYTVNEDTGKMVMEVEEL